MSKYEVIDSIVYPDGSDNKNLSKWEMDHLVNLFEVNVNELVMEGDMDELEALELTKQSIQQLPPHLRSFKAYLIEKGYTEEEAMYLSDLLEEEDNGEDK